MKKHFYIWPTVIALALALGIFVGGKLHFNDTPEKLFSTNSKKDKLNRLIDYIDYEYVDDINTDSIVGDLPTRQGGRDPRVADDRRLQIR